MSKKKGKVVAAKKATEEDPKSLKLLHHAMVETKLNAYDLLGEMGCKLNELSLHTGGLLTEYSKIGYGDDHDRDFGVLPMVRHMSKNLRFLGKVLDDSRCYLGRETGELSERVDECFYEQDDDDCPF